MQYGATKAVDHNAVSLPSYPFSCPMSEPISILSGWDISTLVTFSHTENDWRGICLGNAQSSCFVSVHETGPTPTMVNPICTDPPPCNDTYYAEGINLCKTQEVALPVTDDLASWYQEMCE